MCCERQQVQKEPNLPHKPAATKAHVDNFHEQQHYKQYTLGDNDHPKALNVWG